MPEHDAGLARRTARRAIRLLDLTDLSDHAGDMAVRALCAKAREGGVAAVCVWPRGVAVARAALAGSAVRVATVANFPEGGTEAGPVLDEVARALGEGADEIDLVLPYRAFLDGYRGAAGGMVAAVRAAVPRPGLLKVILETGELGGGAMIREASDLAIAEGADFIKTSTGKTAVSATPEAVETMLGAIRDSGRPVGLKPSGGIRTLAEAGTYLGLADRIMGPDWASPETFRIGASGLYDVLADAMAGRSA